MKTIWLIMVMLLFGTEGFSETYLAIFLGKDFEINKVIVCKTLKEASVVGDGNALIYRWDFNKYKHVRYACEIDYALQGWVIGFDLDKRIRQDKKNK